MIKNIHFIGIGGISMSALAKMSAYFGCKVTGSDKSNSETLEGLKGLGFNVYCGSDINFIVNAELIVYSASIKKDDIELSYAIFHNKEVMDRAKFLAEFSKLCEQTVAISGSHGKTTISAMISHILYDNNFPALCHIGGVLNNYQTNTLINGNKLFVTEACEYNKSFLQLNPDIGIITSLDFDHPDIYTNEKDFINTFIEFSKKKSIKHLICEENIVKYFPNAISYGIEEEIKYFPNAISYGIEEGIKNVHITNLEVGKLCYKAKNIVEYDDSTCYDIFLNDKFIITIIIAMVGKHNILNSLASYICCEKFLDNTLIKKSLASFIGTKRRMEFLGKTISNAKIYIDYAHHPNEIKCALQAVKKMKYNNLFVVFQPHTYSRTKALINEFSLSLINIKNLFITPTYSAREKNNMGFDGKQLFKNISILVSAKNNTRLKIVKEKNLFKSISKYNKTIYCLNTDALLKQLCCAKENDLIIFLGAGDIDCIAKSIVI